MSGLDLILLKMDARKEKNIHVIIIIPAKLSQSDTLPHHSSLDKIKLSHPKGPALKQQQQKLTAMLASVM